MVYDPHEPIKAEKIAATAAVQLEQSLTLPNIMHKEGIDQFKGAKDDTINVTVEGVLPFRTYGWRNDRSTEIQFDKYIEKKVAVKFGGDIYSGVLLTDEQRDFDLDGWTKLVGKQTEAVGRGLNYEAADHIQDAPYDVTLGMARGEIRQTLIAARNILNKMNAPGARTFVCGTDIETALLLEESLNLASSVGADEAMSALSTATIGKRYGFDIVVAQEVAPDEGFFLTEGAFVFATGAPSVPQSIKHGATAATPDGVALRWLMDYDSLHTTERSLVNTYKGFRHIVDELVGRDVATGQAFTSEYSHFVRGIKCVLKDDVAGANAATVVPVAGGGTSADAKKATEFAKITGVTKPVIVDSKPAAGEPAA